MGTTYDMKTGKVAEEISTASTGPMLIKEPLLSRLFRKYKQKKCYIDGIGSWLKQTNGYCKSVGYVLCKGCAYNGKEQCVKLGT